MVSRRGRLPNDVASRHIAILTDFPAKNVIKRMGRRRCRHRPVWRKIEQLWCLSLHSLICAALTTLGVPLGRRWLLHANTMHAYHSAEMHVSSVEVLVTIRTFSDVFSSP